MRNWFATSWMLVALQCRRLALADKPGPPIDVTVTEVWGFNVSLEWKPPKDDGNCEVTGYTIEKADLKTKVGPGRGEENQWWVSLTGQLPHSLSLSFSLCLQEWFTVFEHNRRAGCTVSDLVMGNEYSFRVFSENICGRSDEAGVSKNTAVIGKTGDRTGCF